MIWAQGESGDEAKIYSSNFPEIPFCLEELSYATDKIPSHDLLLASLNISYSIAGKHISDPDGGRINQIKGIISKHQPQAVCIVFSAMQMITRGGDILERFRQENYQYFYRILEKERDGGVPVRGRKGYLVGIREGEDASEFQFPAPCEYVSTIEELWKAEEQEDIYYKIPRRYKELLSRQELKQGKLYQVIFRRMGEKQRIKLRECTACPVLTVRSCQDVFVKDSRGIRNLTAKEYLQLSGDTETMLPLSMPRHRIWMVLNRSGVYAIEKRIAAELMRLFRKEPDKQEEAQKELRTFCDLLLEEKYEEASKSFDKLSRYANRLAEQLRKELEDLAHFREHSTALSGKIMIRLWFLLSKRTQPWTKLKRYVPIEAENEPTKEVDDERLPEKKSSILAEKRKNPYKTSVEKGQTLEQAFLSLLSHLFTWEAADEFRETLSELEFLQKKPGGIQNGRDLDLVYLDETGQKRRCYFECKYINSKKYLKENEIQAKIRESRRSAIEDIEHWILVAPNCRLDSYSVDLFEEEEWRHSFYPPIKNIQVWNTENQIRELIGLEPALYERFFGKVAVLKDDPAGWSEDKRQRIIQKWKKKLMPVLMLPKGLIRYPFEPERLMFDLQNDPAVRRQYEELYLRRTKLKFYEENGMPSREYLEENMLRWLNNEGERVRVVLGEFGDGKTFFLYCLSRRLLEEFVKNPEKNYLPVCISLKNLEHIRDPKAFIAQRMKELSCNYADFLELKEKFHVLICLDGFDEISSVIDRRTVSKNIRLLNDCIELMTKAKILITSRTQCFEQNYVKEWLNERVGGLKALCLAPVEAEAREDFLLSKVSEEKRIEKQERLFADKKLFALMGKPFFLDMMGQLMASGEQTVESSVSIYEHYIRECLKRKFDRSFMYKEDILLNKKETVDRIYEALSEMAYALWQNGQETLSVSEFEKHLGRSAAEVLWKEKNPNENEREDADHRFSMRTLFQYAGDNKVKFSHRSIQEYFVAVYLRYMLQKDSRSFEILLRECYFNDEILRFLSELLTEDKSGWGELRRKLICMVDEAGDEKNQTAKGKSLSGKIMQLFYFTDKKIPTADWHEKNLSNVDIPGADLSGQNLSGSWFINANLNNVRFNDCDCSYCDMTDARLEETCPICSIQYQRGELKCLYRDGSIRKWEVRQQTELSQSSQVPLLETAFMGEYGEIFTQSRDKMRVIEVQKGGVFVRQEYRKHRRRSLLCIQGQTALVKEWNGEHARILLIDMQNYRIVREWSAAKEGNGSLPGGKLAVIFDGRQKIELFSMEEQEDAGTFELDLPGTLITFDAVVKENGVELAAGCTSGDVFVYKCLQGALHLVAQGRQQGLSHVAFCENQSLAAVDGEGAVHMMYWEETKGHLRHDPADTMKLGIFCRNIKTEGLIPEFVQKRLREHSQNHL